MSRRRRRPRPSAPLPRPDVDEVQQHADGGWNVRRLTGSSASKAYTCPACLRLIRPGTPHVLVWPVEKSLLSASAIEERRHWHQDCWRRRL